MSKDKIIRLFLQNNDVPLFNQRDFWDKIIAVLCDAAKAKACSLRLLEGQELTEGVVVGYQDIASRQHRIPIDNFLRKMTEASTPTVIKDLSADPRIPPQRKKRYRKEGFHSYIAVPVTAGDHCLGILSFYYAKSEAVNTNRIRLVQALASLIGYLIHNSVFYEDVAQLRELTRSVLENATDAILLTDELGLILYASSQTARIFHTRPQRLIGQYIFKFDASSTHSLESLLKMAKRRKGIRHSELSIEIKNGQKLSLDVSIMVLRHHLESSIYYLWTIHDLTSLHSAQQAVQKKRAEMENFVYTISHDLKSPLISIQGYVSLLNDEYGEKLDEDGRHYLTRLEKNVSIMRRMIQDLLELSRVGSMDRAMQVVNISNLVRQTLDEFRYQIDQNRVEILVAKRFPRVVCNRKTIKLVFSNLISNAIKFMGEQKNPRIEIGWKQNGNFYQFYVRDNGIGIAKEKQERIFNIFSHLQDLENAEGSGIGLALTKKIIEQHSGQIWVNSEPGKGASFYFSLPKTLVF